MWSESYSFLSFISILSCGFCIKILDNYIDKDFQELIKPNEKKLLSSEAALAYCVILSTLAVLLDSKLGASLIMSSYIIGMFYDMNRRLSIGLRGYQESIILLATGMILIGYVYTITSLGTIIMIQIFDDIIDRKEDKKYGQKNIANNIGLVEATLICIILFLGIIILDFIKPLAVLGCYGIISFIMGGYYNDIYNRINKCFNGILSRLCHRKKDRNIGGDWKRNEY